MKKNENHKLAIWAVTPNGAKLAGKIAQGLGDADVHVSAALGRTAVPSFPFSRLSDALSETFNAYAGHVFIMSTGIVVRVIAPHVRHKTVDPAVVVVDERGDHAISLLSGHIGGANELAKDVAQVIHATPVITTATDINNVPAIDMLAKNRGLFIENPDAIKRVNMALLTGKDIRIHDPLGLMRGAVRGLGPGVRGEGELPDVFVDDVIAELPPQVLILRPCSLVAGMGCNRNTSMEEMKSLLCEVLETFGLSQNSLESIATIDIKNDEPGLIALAKDLGLPLRFFSRQELNQVKTIETPSEMVEKHIGVKSVCEAAAILASKTGRLIVPKHSTRNVTVAIARMSFTS